jgi:HTH-type transcriptional regulator/antitoxin HigA
VITNEVQYRATKAHLAKFEEAAANLEVTLAKGGARARLTQLELDAVRAQADDLRAEIEEYDRLRSGAVSAFEATSLAELATLLVKARIARGWTQRRLADALGIAEQQVQRYESSGYRSASLARICDVAAALDIVVTERAVLRDPDAA